MFFKNSIPGKTTISFIRNMSQHKAQFTHLFVIKLTFIFMWVRLMNNQLKIWKKKLWPHRIDHPGDNEDSISFFIFSYLQWNMITISFTSTISHIASVPDLLVLALVPGVDKAQHVSHCGCWHRTERFHSLRGGGGASSCGGGSSGHGGGGGGSHGGGGGVCCPASAGTGAPGPPHQVEHDRHFCAHCNGRNFSIRITVLGLPAVHTADGFTVYSVHTVRNEFTVHNFTQYTL